MKREDLQELLYIIPIQNLPSVLQHGILSHRRAARLQHSSVAKAEVQDMRAKRLVPGGRPIHEYANLYFCARNPMLFLRKDQADSLCVLRVDPGVLDLPNVIVADMNAVSGHARFRTASEGIEILPKEDVFAENWKHPEDQIREWRHKAVKCAEVLVPDRVPPKFISGAYVAGETAATLLRDAAPTLAVTIDAHLFFR